jgi:hypothetical protein
MTNDFTYVGDEGNGTEEISWMDFRDLLIEQLHNTDTELKFNKILMAIVFSICPSPDILINTRKSVGMEVSKDDEKKIKKMYEEHEKKYYSLDKS